MTEPSIEFVCLVIMAKAPVAGRAKTRLIPALGEDGAAQIAQSLLLHTAQQAMKAVESCGKPKLELLMCAEPSKEGEAWQPFLREWHALSSATCNPPPIRWERQTPGDLGQRMWGAVANSQPTTCQPTIWLGMDCPTLSAQHIQHMADLLTQYDAVIVPSTDGGYVALGMRYPNWRVFDGVAWSTERVFSETYRRMQELNWQFVVLPAHTDIDTPDDLRHVHEQGGLPPAVVSVLSSI